MAKKSTQNKCCISNQVIRGMVMGGGSGVTPPTIPDFLLLETGDFILLETGFQIIKE